MIAGGIASTSNPIFTLFTLFDLPFAWVLLFVRTRPGRILFYIQAVSSIVFSVTYCIWAVLGNDSISDIIGFIPPSGIIGVLLGIADLVIGIEVLKSLRVAYLFEPNGFTHSQICQAKKKRKKGIEFTDEELISFKPNKLLSTICVVISYILTGATIVGGIFMIAFYFENVF